MSDWGDWLFVCVLRKLFAAAMKCNGMRIAMCLLWVGSKSVTKINCEGDTLSGAEGVECGAKEKRPKSPRFSGGGGFFSGARQWVISGYSFYIRFLFSELLVRG